MLRPETPLTRRLLVYFHSGAYTRWSKKSKELFYGSGEGLVVQCRGVYSPDMPRPTASSARAHAELTQQGICDVKACYELACQLAEEFFTRYGEEHELTRWASKAKAHLEMVRHDPRAA